MELKLGELADAIYAQNAKIATVNAKLKDAENERKELEDELLLRMQDAGTDIVRGKKATVSISETTRAQIQDPVKFEAFVLRKKALHLFERRISSKAYSEMKKLLGNKPVPGLVDFTSVRLNVRKAGS